MVEQSTRARPAPPGGFTLVEVVFAATILVVLGYFLTNLLISSAGAQKYAERNARVVELSQELVDGVRREVTSSVRLMHDDAIGNAYAGLLDFAGGRAPIAYRLPALVATGIFEQETAAQPRTGNALLFARHAWTARYTTAQAGVYQVDVYRVVFYFPTAEGAGPTPGEPGGLNLARWVSEPLVDGDQIDRIGDPTDQAEVLQNLLLRAADDNGVVHPSVEVVWLRGEDPALPGTLRHIQSSGALSLTPQPPRAPTWRLQRDPTRSIDGMLQHRHFSLATNHAPAVYAVGRFSLPISTGAGFPHGLEVQLIGPSSARQVLLRLVLVSTHHDGHRAHTALQAILDARDL